MEVDKGYKMPYAHVYVARRTNEDLGHMRLDPSNVFKDARKSLREALLRSSKVSRCYARSYKRS